MFQRPEESFSDGIIVAATSAAARWRDIFGSICVCAVWLSTLGLSVPCHDRLHRSGYDLPTIKRLVHTNWIRTVAWTAMLAVDLITLSPVVLEPETRPQAVLDRQTQVMMKPG